MKEESIQKLEELVKETVTDEIFSRADEIKNEYLRACEALNREQLQQFLADGGNSDEFEPKKDPLDNRFNELLHIFSDRETKFRKFKADEIQTKLREKEEIIANLEKLIAE